MTAETTQEGEMTGVTEGAVDAAHAAATEFAQRWGDPVPPRGMIRRMLGASARMWSTQELAIDRLRTIIRNVDQWLDAEVSVGYQGQPLAQDWARVAKITEEVGEAIDALIGCTGQNPRKGHYGTADDLLGELGDVVVTGMFAIQHFTKDERQTFAIVMAALEKAAKRAAEAGYGDDLCYDPAACANGPLSHSRHHSCALDRD